MALIIVDLKQEEEGELNVFQMRPTFYAFWAPKPNRGAAFADPRPLIISSRVVNRITWLIFGVK